MAAMAGPRSEAWHLWQSESDKKIEKGEGKK